MNLPELKAVASGLDVEIELLEIDALQKAMLRGEVIKVICGTSGALQIELVRCRAGLALSRQAFERIHEAAVAANGDAAERLLAVAGNAWRNAREIERFLKDSRG